MRKNLKHWGAALSIIALVSLIGCDRDKKSESEPQTVTIGTFSRAIDYAPFYVAKRFGWFAQAMDKYGKEVKFREFNTRSDIGAALDAGALDVVFAAAPPIIITRAAGHSVEIFEVSATLQQEILVRSSLDVHDAQDLSGLRIAVLEGTSSHYGLLRVLEQAGVNEREVELVYQGPSEAQPGFEGGSVDAWAVWPPYVEEQQHVGNGVVLQGGDAVIQSVVAVSTELIESNPEAVEALGGAIRKAKAWILNNPDQAQAIVARDLRIDPAIVELAWGKHDWSSRMDSSFEKDVAAKTRFLRESGQLRDSAPENLADSLLNTRFGGGDALRR